MTRRRWRALLNPFRRRRGRHGRTGDRDLLALAIAVGVVTTTPEEER